MIRSMTESDYIQESKNALLKLCGTEHPDPSLEPFLTKVEKSLVLYPYIAGLPDDELMKAMAVAANKLGDHGFYLSANFKRPLDEKYIFHWYITFDEMMEYKKVTEPYAYAMEYILYSPQGLWGIVSSDESHGVLGGSSVFVDEIIHAIPQINEQVSDFIAFWKEFKRRHPQKVNASWMEILLENTYGKAHADKLLQEAKWAEIAELNKRYPYAPEYRFR